GLLVLVVSTSVIGAILNEMLSSHWGKLLSLGSLIRNVWAGLFGTFVQQVGQVQQVRRGEIIREAWVTEPPLWASWLVLFLICALCLWLLSRKVKAYEV